MRRSSPTTTMRRCSAWRIRRRARLSEVQRERVVQRATRAVGGLKDADAVGRTDEVHAVEDVQEREPLRKERRTRAVPRALDAQVCLHDLRQLCEVRKPGTQTAAVETVGGDRPGTGPPARPRGGTGERLMIEHDRMAVDVGELRGVEIELTRDDAALPVAPEREVGIGREARALIAGGELRSPHVAGAVVEGREDRHDAELAGVEVAR